MIKLMSFRPWQADLGLLLLRVFAGLSMAFGHGYGKLQKATAGGEIDFYELWGMSPELSLWLAVFAEFFAGILLALGLFSRLSLLPLLFTMAIAAFDVHLDDPYKKMEMALLYFIVYSCLMFTGPGKYSLDAFFSRSMGR